MCNLCWNEVGCAPRYCDVEGCPGSIWKDDFHSPCSHWWTAFHECEGTTPAWERHGANTDVGIVRPVEESHFSSLADPLRDLPHLWELAAFCFRVKSDQDWIRARMRYSRSLSELPVTIQESLTLIE